MSKTFDKYLPKRSVNEPHDKKCQKTRMGPQHCCTCESNMTRRRIQVENAARMNDTGFLKTLGCMEQYAWHEARKVMDPDHCNPYKMEDRRRAQG